MNIGKQVCMRKYHAFWVARRAGSVLQKSDVFSARVMRQVFHRAPLRRSRFLLRLGCGIGQLLRVQHISQRRNSRLKQPGEPFGLPPGNQKARFRVAQDVGLPLCIFRDAVRAERRINWHWNSAGKQNAREGPEEFGASGKHNRNSLSRLQPAA